MAQNVVKSAAKPLSRKSRLASFVARKRVRRSPRNAKRLNASAIHAMLDTEHTWIVVNAPPQSEFAAQSEIADAGFLAYALTETVWHSPTPVRGHKPKRSLVTRPLLPRMLFVGVCGPVGRFFELIDSEIAKSADDRPGGVLAVPGDVLHEFVTRVGVADPVAFLREHARFRVGQRVEVSSGPLAGQSGAVVEMNSKRIKVGVELFGTITDASFSVDALRESG